MRRATLPAAAALVATLLAAGPAAADQLLLQQNLPGNAAGTAFLLVDRTRISLVSVTKDASQVHRLVIRLATEPPQEVTLTCNDQAVTRQVLDALRRGAVPLLDVTGRCRL